MAIVNANQKGKTVADPNAAYLSIRDTWSRNRAVYNGERFVKDYDRILNTFVSDGNLLLPFSASMTQAQYDFYRAEAELPGITSQYVRMLAGGILRKGPQLTLPNEVPKDVRDWLVNEFSQDSSSLLSFVEKVLLEELQTARAWIYVDYPKVKNPSRMTTEDYLALKPYPVMWDAESVINWRVEKDPDSGAKRLMQVIVSGYTEDILANEFHPALVETIWVHEIVNKKYQVRIFKLGTEQPVIVAGGKRQTQNSASKPVYLLTDTITGYKIQGQPLDFIPAWPVSGDVELTDPLITALVNKEVALYNKVSRRNHLLYGAATYTPIITTSMTDEQFDAVVESGLGTWIKLRQGDTATVLETPTGALTDMDRAIAANIEDMAKLGVRMLTPEISQSGVALELRNATQTAVLGTLNAKMCAVFKTVIAFMIQWRYGISLNSADIEFILSDDFENNNITVDWMRLATEWYQSGLIPRSSWLILLKNNDLLPRDYDDIAAQNETTNDPNMIPKASDSEISAL